MYERTIHSISIQGLSPLNANKLCGSEMGGTELLLVPISSGSLLCNPAFASRASFARKKSFLKVKRKPVRCIWDFFGRGKESSSSDSTHQHDVELPPMLSTLLKDTFLADKDLKCCYKASLDGFSAYTFHSHCDFKGPCVVVGLTESGLRFGGFNPLGFRSTDDYYETFKAFLFYWPDQNSPPVALPKVGGCGAAVFDYARGGPQFGADGLLIGPPLVPVMGGFAGPDPNIGEGDLSQAKSRLGLSYARRPDGKDSIFGDEKRVRLAEVEVFACPAIASMY